MQCAGVGVVCSKICFWCGGPFIDWHLDLFCFILLFLTRSLYRRGFCLGHILCLSIFVVITNFFVLQFCSHMIASSPWLLANSLRMTNQADLFNLSGFPWFSNFFFLTDEIPRWKVYVRTRVKVCRKTRSWLFLLLKMMLVVILY